MQLVGHWQLKDTFDCSIAVFSDILLLYILNFQLLNYRNIALSNFFYC